MTTEMHTAHHPTADQAATHTASRTAPRGVHR